MCFTTSAPWQWIFARASGGPLIVVNAPRLGSGLALDLRPVVFCAFLPLITTVCIRGMRQAETEHGADLWDVAFVLSLLCAVIALLAVYVR